MILWNLRVLFNKNIIMNINRIKVKYSCRKEKTSPQITSTQENATGSLLQVQGQHGLHSYKSNLIIWHILPSSGVLALYFRTAVRHGKYKLSIINQQCKLRTIPVFLTGSKIKYFLFLSPRFKIYWFFWTLFPQYSKTTWNPFHL